MNADGTRTARVRAVAKVNLDLRVLGKRPDGYHELRTVFQTISLADRLKIAFTPAKRTEIEFDDPLGLKEGNLIVRAARRVLDECRVRGRVHMQLSKQIPMGAGLGGGSSDAAAVLLALPVLAGGVLDSGRPQRIAEELGSDVPFFLLGGRAVGIGRGSEVFPLADGRAWRGVIGVTGVHVSTADAYRALSPGLTSESQQNKIFSFQSQAWEQDSWVGAGNDFEAVVFGEHKKVAALKRKLARAGAAHALMTGSGSAVYGLFRTAAEADRAIEQLGSDRTIRMNLMSRARYRSMWWSALREHISGRTWPPRSRYAV